jgi:hypothetical protein
VAHGQLWRLVTYPLVNPPSFWFALEMVMLYYFGRLVEWGIGSRSFVLFYGGLVLLQGVLFQLTHLIGYPTEAHGIEMISMALFAAFVAMYPSASFFFGIAARWMLLLLLGLSSLQLLAEHQWISMLQLLALSITAVFFMKWKGYQEALYFFSTTDHTIKELVAKPVKLPPPETQREDRYFAGSTFLTSLSTENPNKSAPSLLPSFQQETKKSVSMIHIDQLLDKINATGLSSLTHQEKERLEAARLALLERDKRS